MIHINWNYINGSVEIEEKSREAEENYFFAQIVKLSNFGFAIDFYMAAEVRYYCFVSLFGVFLNISSYPRTGVLSFGVSLFALPARFLVNSPQSSPSLERFFVRIHVTYYCN